MLPNIVLVHLVYFQWAYVDWYGSDKFNESENQPGFINLQGALMQRMFILRSRCCILLLTVGPGDLLPRISELIARISHGKLGQFLRGLPSELGAVDSPLGGGGSTQKPKARKSNIS
jgi:hypothetical protein